MKSSMSAIISKSGNQSRIFIRNFYEFGVLISKATVELLAAECLEERDVRHR